MSGKKKKLLIYAHYYHPDVASTGQLLKEQAEGLADVFDTTVICVVPSYDGSVAPEYQTKKYYEEELNGVHIIRVRVPPFNKTNKVSRVKNILAYFFNALGATAKVGKVDYVFTISQPPVLGGLLGVCGKWLKKAKLIYCIQDFNPEQIIATGYSKNKLVLNAMMALDKFSCRQSNLVITVGRDLVDTLKNRFKNGCCPRYAFINNWIDENEIYPLPRSESHVQVFLKKYDLEDKFVFMYSGNLGLYYDLVSFLKVVEKFPAKTKTKDGREVVFAFVGAGSVKKNMEQYATTHDMTNVRFIPYQDKADLVYSLNAADVHICISAKGIKGVSCPSKFYGIMAVAKPCLAVMEPGAETRLILEETQCGKVCEPMDYQTMLENIKWFVDHEGTPELCQMGQRGREYLEKNLTKAVSLRKYENAIIDCKQ